MDVLLYLSHPSRAGTMTSETASAALELASKTSGRVNITGWSPHASLIFNAASKLSRAVTITLEPQRLSSFAARNRVQHAILPIKRIFNPWDLFLVQRLRDVGVKPWFRYEYRFERIRDVIQLSQMCVKESVGLILRPFPEAYFSEAEQKSLFRFCADKPGVLLALPNWFAWLGIENGLSRCPAGTDRLAVLPDGSVLACQCADPSLPLGYMTEIGTALGEALEFRRRYREAKVECGRCPLSSTCRSGCDNLSYFSCPTRKESGESFTEKAEWVQGLDLLWV